MKKQSELTKWFRLNSRVYYYKQFFILLCFFTFQVNAQYVRTSGTKILDGNGDEIFFTGINLGNWFLWEGYCMMNENIYMTHSQFFDGAKKAFGNDLGKAMEFEHQWRLNYVSEQTIIDLKNLGYNSVRVPFHFNMFWDWGTYSPRDHGFQYIDALVDHCRTHGLYILLDMHAAPGYQNMGDHCDNGNSLAPTTAYQHTVDFWTGDNVNIAAQVWKHIANRYKNEPVIWGYDLINEPVPSEAEKYGLLGSLVTLRNAIRQVDNNHIIVAEGSWWGSDMQPLDWREPQVQSQSGVSSRWDNNLVYQTHHYSGQGDASTTALDQRLALCNALNVPLILGEIGENTESVLRSFSDWSINNNVGYFPWSFKKISKDRCLWTIPTNSAFEQLKTAITNNQAGPPGLYNDMILFAQNNCKNGHSSHTWHQGFYNAIKNPQAIGGPLPSGWLNKDIGAVGATGSASYLNGTYTIKGSGANIYGTSDEFHFAYKNLSGNKEIIAKVVSMTNVTTWTKSGVMFRDNTHANSKFVMVYQRPDNFVVMQWRTSAGASVVSESPTGGTASVKYLKLVRNGNSFTGYYSTDGANYTKITSVSNSIASTAKVGLAVCSRVDGSICTAKFSNVAINNVGSFSVTVQAEDYFNMNGVQTETTGDVGGGLNVGWIDTYDWMGYSLNLPNSGTYTIEYRVASLDGGKLRFEKYGSNPKYGEIDIPATGGWQTYTTIRHTVSLPAGTNSYAIYALQPGWNINWFRVTEGIKSADGAYRAEPENALSVYPNPVNQLLHVNGLNTPGQIEVYSLSGIQMIKTSGFFVDMNDLPVGIYVVRVYQEDNVYQVKVVKR